MIGIVVGNVELMEGMTKGMAEGMIVVVRRMVLQTT
jgi:hypothetical protein